MNQMAFKLLPNPEVLAVRGAHWLGCSQFEATTGFSSGLSSRMPTERATETVGEGIVSGLGAAGEGRGKRAAQTTGRGLRA